MELKEVESATCSSRTLITGFNFHFCSDLLTIGIVSLPKVFIQTQINQQYHLLSLPARATLTAVWEVKEWAGSMPWSAATTTRSPFYLTWSWLLFNLCTWQTLLSRVTLLSHRAPTSRQRLRSTSRSSNKNWKHKLHHLEQKSIKKLHCRLEEESQHKLHRFEQKLKPFDCLQIADGGTLGLSAWWLGGNDMHQEGAWSWPRWKLRFIFRWLHNLCFQRPAFWLHQLDRRRTQWQQWPGRLHCHWQVFENPLFIFLGKILAFHILWGTLTLRIILTKCSHSPKNYQWMDLNCTDPIHGAVTHFAVCERIPA